MKNMEEIILGNSKLYRNFGELYQNLHKFS